MRVYDGIKDMLCRELEEVQHKELSSNNLDMIYKSVDILKDITTIEAMENEYSNDYSGRPRYSYDNSYDNAYDGRGRGRYANRDSQGRYASDYSGNSEEEIRRIMERSRDEHEREVLRNALENLKR